MILNKHKETRQHFYVLLVVSWRRCCMPDVLETMLNPLLLQTTKGIVKTCSLFKVRVNDRLPHEYHLRVPRQSLRSVHYITLF